MITLAKAKQALEVGEAKARELGVAVTLTVVDSAGSVVATNRMDGAITISPKFAYEKAYTSASLGAKTADLAAYAKEGKPYFGLTDIFGGRLTTIAGGVPVMMDNKLVGGIGVGGSMDVSQDAQIAEEVAKLLG
jgi:uncharacterized protein GlcG (DUF336 family)